MVPIGSRPLSPLLVLLLSSIIGGLGQKPANASERRIASAEIPLSAGETVSRTFEVSADERFWVEIEQQGIDVELRLSSPESTGEVEVFDSPSGRFGHEIALSGQRGGRRVLELRAGNEAGRGTVWLEARAAAEPPPGYELWSAALAAFADGNKVAPFAAEDATIEPLPPRARASLRATLAELYRRQGELPLAHSHWQRSLDEYRSANDLHGQARALDALGLLAAGRGANEEAREAFEAALVLARRLGDHHALAQILNNAGFALLRDFSPREAAPLLEEALSEARLADSGRILASALNNLGAAQQVLGEVPTARRHFEEAAAIHRDQEALSELANTLLNLASLARLAQEESTATRLNLEALEIYRAQKDPRGEARALNNLAAMALAKGDGERARPHLERALLLRRQTKDRRGEATTLHNLARAQQHLGHDKEARRLYLEALALRQSLADRRGAATTLDFLGALELEVGNAGEAKHLFAEAQQTFAGNGDQRRQARAQRHWGEAALADHELAAAEKALKEARELHYEHGELFEASLAAFALARLDLLAGRHAAARKTLAEVLGDLSRRAAEFVDPESAASFFKLCRDIYGLALELSAEDALESGEDSDAWEALALSESARNHGLLARLRSRRPEKGDEGLARRRLEERLAGKVNARRNALDKGSRQEKEKLASEIAALESELDLHETRAWSSLAEAPSGASAGTSAGARQQSETLALLRAASQSSLVLELALGARASWLFVIDRGHCRLFRLPPGPALERSARELLAAFSKRDRGAAHEAQIAAQELSDRLLGPVAHLLARRPLIFLPDGAFHSFPLAALPPPQAAAAAPAATPTLGHRHQIVYWPSASFAAARAEAKIERPLKVAIFADPGASSGLPAAEWTREEARRIALLLPSEQKASLAGQVAQNKGIAAGDLSAYSHLHFATHGQVDEEHWRLSGLLLGNPALTGSSIFGLSDLAHLHLTADLVVLSGCQTARGRELPGEGVVGLTQGFLAAGAKQVLASLWPVEDRATAELMERFYLAMWRQGLSPAAALQAAQRSLQRDPRWRNAYSWAGFVLVGSELP